MTALIQQILDAIPEVFGFRATLHHDGDQGAIPLSVGDGIPDVFVPCDDLQTRAQVVRFVRREAKLLDRMHSNERRLHDLKNKTARLIPDDRHPTGNNLRYWTIDSADIALLESFDRWAIAVDGELVRHRGMIEADVQTTLRVLQKESRREIPIGKGVLFGQAADNVAVVVMSETQLDPIDKELVGLQANWLRQILAQIEYLNTLDELSKQLTHSNQHLTAALTQATQATAAKTTFLAHMSHELRTPLNGILGIAQILADTDLNQDQAELVALQLESGNWLREIINAVLDLSKIEAGSMELDPTPFDLRELATRTIRGVQTLAGAKGLALHLDVEADCPNWVHGDETRIRQSILNLLSNALKFTTQGSVSLSVSRVRGSNVRFAVTDTGVGIPAERLDAVFRPYEQASKSTSKTYGGTGLGLPLVREFAELHGGQAGVESTLGEGSTFWFTAGLPATRAPAGTDAVELSQEPPLHILVAEDDRVSQRVVTRMLEDRGHRVELVGDGRAAVQRVHEGAAFDLVLMDGMMPILNGVDATAEIRRTHDREDLPIFALSANVTAEERERFFAAGVNGLVPKPLERETLVRALQAVATGAEPSGVYLASKWPSAT